MPVRIVLRGLILVSVNRDKEHAENGTITAKLINGTHTLAKAMGDAVNMHMVHQKKNDPALMDVIKKDHETRMHGHAMNCTHKGEIQIFDGENDDAGLIPLGAKKDLNIRFEDDNTEYVGREQSYENYMPQIRRIAKLAGLKQHEPDSYFVSHTVTVNRGTIRVRSVSEWDTGSPDIPAHFGDPKELYQPAKVKFLHVPVEGYVATECVIDVENSNTVTIDYDAPVARKYTGRAKPSLRVPEHTVEILITNYAAQQTIPEPWTLHYRWMFEAAGYRPTSLAGHELNELAKFAEQYDAVTWHDELAMFVGSKPEYEGYPFPYRTPNLWRVPLGPLDYTKHLVEVSDPWDPVRCPMGDLTDDGT